MKLAIISTYYFLYKHWKHRIFKPLQSKKNINTYKNSPTKLFYNSSFYLAKDNQNLLLRDNHLHTLSVIQYSTYFLRGHMSSLNDLISCYKISNGAPQKHKGAMS